MRNQSRPTKEIKSLQTTSKEVLGGVELTKYTMESREIDKARKVVIAFNRKTGENFFAEGVLGKALRDNDGDLKLAIADINDFNDKYWKLKAVYPDNPKYTEDRKNLLAGFQSLVNEYDLNVATATEAAQLTRAIISHNRNELKRLRDDMRSKKEMGKEPDFSEQCAYREEKAKLTSPYSALNLLRIGIEKEEYNYDELMYMINEKNEISRHSLRLMEKSLI